MTGRVLAGYRHDIQITDRLTGRLMAVIAGAALAAFVVFGLGL